MITKCVNPSCRQPFLYFRGGKLFILDVGSNQQPADRGSTHRVPRKLEHFWLCEHCAPDMTLVVRQGTTPTVISTCQEIQSSGERPPQQPRGAAFVQGTL